MPESSRRWRLGGGDWDVTGRALRGGEGTTVCLGGSAWFTAVLTGSGDKDLDRLLGIAAAAAAAASTGLEAI